MWTKRALTIVLYVLTIWTTTPTAVTPIRRTPVSILPLQQTDAMHFQEKGNIIGNVHFGHLSFKIEIEEEIDLLDQTCRTFHHLQRKGEPEKKHGTEQTIGELCSTTLDSLRDIDKMFNGHIRRRQTDSHGNGHSNDRIREPRQAGIIAIGSVVIGGLIGWISHKIWGSITPDPTVTQELDIEHTRSSVNKIAIGRCLDAARQLARRQRRFTYYNDDMHMYMQALVTLNTVGARAERLIAGTSDLIHGRLSPTLIEPKYLREALATLEEKLEKNGLILAIDYAHQAYDYPVSYQRLENKTIVAHLHIPALAQNDIMTLYKFMPLPLQVDTDVNDAFALPLPNDMFIAVNRDRTRYKQVSSLEMATECSHVGDLFFCQNSNQVTKKSKPSCLLAMFQSNYEDVKAHCRFDFRPQLDELVQLDQNSFILFQTTHAPIDIWCDEKKFSTQVPAYKGLQRVDLPMGCKAESRSFEFQSQTTISTQTSTIYPIHVAPINMTAITNHDTDISAKLIASLSHDQLEFTNSFKQIDDMQTSLDHHYLTKLVTLPSASGLLIICIVCICIYKYYCSCAMPRLRFRTPIMITPSEIPPPLDKPEATNTVSTFQMNAM